jgi:Tfp pilus assembly protein PilV
MMRHAGFSLIEVLVSFFLLSLMLLGLDAMQITALRQAKTACYFSVATQQLNVMAERLDVLKDSDPTEQLTRWNQQNQTVLPQGRGTLSGNYPQFLLSIFWGDKNIQKCNQNKIGQSGCLHLIVHV